MKILLDLQSLQTNSRKRGIGRYTICFLKEFYQKSHEDNVTLLINADPFLSPDKLEERLCTLFPRWSVIRLYTPKLLALTASVSSYILDIADEVRGFFINELQPDIFHIFSYFEGYRDPSVTGVPSHYLGLFPVTLTIFDLIPLMNPQEYLAKDPTFRSYYLRSIRHVSLFDHFLAISDSAKQEIVDYLDIEPSKISVATLGPMQACGISQHQTSSKQILKSLGLDPDFLLYVGGADSRKNLERLVEAWCLLDVHTQEVHPLVLAGNIPETIQLRLAKVVSEKQAVVKNIVFLGEVTDQQLEVLYKYSRLFVFPSWHEGFGLPVLEAMVAGCVSICANTSSLPEVIGMQEAQFNPFDIHDIASLIMQGIYDENFRARFRAHAYHYSQRFTWEITVSRSYEAWNNMLRCKRYESRSTLSQLRYSERLKAMIIRISKKLACIKSPIEQTLCIQQIAESISENEKAIQKLCRRSVAQTAQS